MSVEYSSFYFLALFAFLEGIFAGLFYEFFRLLHCLHPRATVLIFLEDILFCLGCACGMLLLFFNLSYGRMRMYAFVFAIAGFFVWYFTLGKLFRKSVSLFASLVRPRMQRVKAYGYTRVQTTRYMYMAKNGFGGSTFLRRK